MLRSNSLTDDRITMLSMVDDNLKARDMGIGVIGAVCDFL